MIVDISQKIDNNHSKCKWSKDPIKRQLVRLKKKTSSTYMLPTEIKFKYYNTNRLKVKGQ